MITTNFHTHTVFGDGKDTPEEMVAEAIKKGFTALGFSEHSVLPIENDFSMTAKTEALYFNEIKRLKENHKNDIEIFCGVELDYFSKTPDFKYDYIIGSVHYVLKDGNYIPVDLDAESVTDAVNKYHGGNFDAYAEDYFSLESDVLNKTNADIIGHIDLITKFCEKADFRLSDRYFELAESCIKKLTPYNKPFEINTGAIARGYRTTPYPSPEILKMIRQYGGKIMLSSDCHNKSFLDCAIQNAVNLAINCGFSEYGIVTESGIKYIPF